MELQPPPAPTDPAVYIPPRAAAVIASVARGAAIGASVGVAFHAVAGGGLRALGRKTLTVQVVGTV